MLKGYIAEMGLDHIVKNVILSERDKKILQERMEDFLERQGTINEFSLRDEEIDFGALAEYLRVDLFDDIHAYFEANWRNRGTVKAGIISKAISYAQANTNVSRKRAVEFTEKAIELIRYYKKTKLGDDLKLIVSELQECVVDTVEHSTESQTKELKRIGAEAKEELLSAVKYNNLMSLDRNVELLQVGKIEQVEMNIKNVLKAMNSAHSLFPNYGYDYNGRFYSKPLTQEALEIYPPKISCTGTAQIDGKYINKLDRDTIEYANRHQLPIVLNIITAKKFLGDIEDPVQYEATDLVGEKITIAPKPFPKAQPCSISINDEVVFDYVLLRTEEVLDDGSIVLSNREQTNMPYKIKITANIVQGHTSYSISMDGANNREVLHCLKFLKQASSGAEIKIKVLSLGEELARGKTGVLDYSTGFESIENEIAFIEKIVEIESYFDEPIIIPKLITEDDYYAVSYLATLITGGENTGGWSKFEFEIPLSVKLKSILEECDNSSFTLSYVGCVTVKFFDKAYEVSVVKTLDSLKYQNIEKLKQKVEVLEDGDPIKLTFLPIEGENGIWRDKLYIEDDGNVNKGEV